MNNVGYTDGAPYAPFQNYIDIAQLAKSTITEKLVDTMPIRGFTYGYLANRGQIRSQQGLYSQEKMYQLGVNWVCLAVVNYQSTYASTDIHSDYYRTPTDWDIMAFVSNARKHNVKICLKPMVNSEDGIWRAHIGFPDLKTDDMNSYWDKWFKSYTNYILHYAELARELKIEMLCIGCEMIGTEHREADWLNLISKIRNIYQGKIVYNTNHGHEDSVAWFDALDYIGISAYYPVGKNGTTKDDMTKAWTDVKYRLDAIAENRGKQYIFMEIGCRSGDGCSAKPYDCVVSDEKWNEEEQANFYESCFEVFKNDKYFAGVFWWQWSTCIYDSRESAKRDTGFDIHLKKAEEVVKNHYIATK
jgi:hypothetical protein